MPFRVHIMGLALALAAPLATGCVAPREAASEPTRPDIWLPPPDAVASLSETPYDDLDYVSAPETADAGVAMARDVMAPSERAAGGGFVHAAHNPFARVATTTEVDSYDTFARGAAYAVLPPSESVSAASFVNAFDYAYPAPTEDEAHPFHVELDVADHPLGRMANLLRVSLRAEDSEDDDPRVVAEDVEVVVEMNPSWVAAYRLVGFAGPVGADELAADSEAGSSQDERSLVAGQRFTALFELVPKGYPIPDPEGAPAALAGPAVEGERHVDYGEMARVTVRYRRPDGDTMAEPCAAAVDTTDMVEEPLAMDDDFLWAAAMAGLAEHLAGSPYAGAGERVVISDLLERAAGDDPAREELLYAFHKIESQLDP